MRTGITSGAKWFDSLPSNWEERKIQYSAKVFSGGTPDRNNPDYWDNGTIPWLSSGEINKGEIFAADGLITDIALKESSAKWAGKGTVLIALNGQGKTKGTVALLECDSSINQSLCCISPDEEHFYKYIKYFLESRYGQIRGLVGEDRDGLNLALIKSIVLPLPPLPIQKTIAAYLDKGTSRIDELIVKKERQIELLQEKRQAIITRAVTKGLDPKAKMVDSGVVWIGEIPEGWKVTRLKYLASMLSGFAFHSEDFNDTGIQLIKISNLYCNKLQLERQPTFVPESFKENYKEWLVTNGDILMSMTGTLGKRDYGFAIQIENEEEEFLLNQRVSKIVPKPNITANMLVHIVRSDYFQNQIFLLPSGTKQGNFSNEQILGTYVIYPPKKEIQNEITMFIKGQFVANDKLIHKIEASISLLREYRSSLITAAVSGQIDVAKMEVAG